MKKKTVELSIADMELLRKVLGEIDTDFEERNSMVFSKNEMKSVSKLYNLSNSY